MFVNLAVIACFVAAGLAQKWNGPLAGGEPAARYPAGVSPQACPNFPHCSNPALSANPSAPAPHVAPSYNQGQAYNQGQPYNQGQAYQGAYNPAPVAYNAAPVYNSAPAYNQYNGGYNSAQDALNKGEYIGDGDYKGEGLAESGAFGPADHSNNQVHGAYNSAPVAYNAAPAYNHGTYHAAPATHGHPAQVPAGVDPNFCPNYPYCN